MAGSPKSIPHEIPEGDFSGLHFAIVYSRFNQSITEGLLNASLDCFKMAGVPREHIEVVAVPGAFEIPAAVKLLADHRQLDGIVTLGAVIQGQTDHHVYINQAVTEALMRLSLSLPTPLVFGILTPQNMEQAEARALGLPEHNKGREVTLALLEIVGTYGKLRESSRINL